jgi:hypothetical protein
MRASYSVYANAERIEVLRMITQIMVDWMASTNPDMTKLPRQ